MPRRTANRSTGAGPIPAAREGIAKGEREMATIVRSEREINDMLAKCADAMADGSAYPGMTYEEGAEYAIKWLTDKDADPIFED